MLHENKNSASFLTLVFEVLKASVSAAMAVFMAVPVELNPLASILFLLRLSAQKKTKTYAMW